jgi:hypothetical protein
MPLALEDLGQKRWYAFCIGPQCDDASRCMIFYVIHHHYTIMYYIGVGYC